MADLEIKDLAPLAESLRKATDETKALATELLGKSAAGEKISQSAKEKADEALLKLNGMTAEIEAIQQKMAKRSEVEDGKASAKSFGTQFVESEQFKKAAGNSGARERIRMEFKATITLATTDTAGAAGDLVQNTRLPGIIELPQRKMTVRDLISPGRMDGNTLEYAKETGFTNNAGMVAEAAAKPNSDMKFDLVTTSAKVIAHYMKASRQVLSDSSQLASLIDQRLRYGLAYKEEDQLLNGDGTGQNLLGIIPQATAYVAPFDPAGTETNIDFIRLALLQASLAEYPATATVMHPSDWARIELLKDTTGRYLIGNPQGTLSPTLWGLPVVTTQAIAVDKFLTGAFKQGAQLFDRWLSAVTVATENEDDFVKNLVTVLAEERLALAVYRPQAFIYGDFGNVV